MEPNPDMLFEKEIKRKFDHFDPIPDKKVLERIMESRAAFQPARITGNKTHGWIWYGLTLFVLITGLTFLWIMDSDKEAEAVDFTSSITQNPVIEENHTAINGLAKNISGLPEEMTSSSEPFTENRKNGSVIVMPTPHAGQDIEVCGLKAGLKAIVSVSGAAGRWVSENRKVVFVSKKAEDPATDPEATVIVEEYGVYKLKWMETAGKVSATDEINVHFREVPEVSLGEDKAVCGFEFEINSGGQNGYWSGSDGIIVSNPRESVTRINTVESGQYKLIWTEKKESCSASDTILLTFIDQPLAEIKVHRTGVCYSSPVRVSCSYHKNYDYRWNFDQGTVNKMNETDYLVTWKKGEEHKISLTVSNRESCQSFAEVTLKLPPQPEAFFDQQIAESEPPSMVYFTNHSTLSGQKDDGKDMSYFWDFGDGNYSEEMHPEHLYTTSGVYSVKLIARDHMGCGDTITGEPVRIKSRSVHNQSRYFSPNGDGINDVFKVNNPDLTEFTVSIMMNNGEVIFQWNQPEEGWNGKLPGGNYAAQGLYYYIIRGKDISGRLVEIPGTVYLVKE